MNKKLRKSRTNIVFTGTLAGIAEYFGIDPTIVRVIYVFLSIVSVGFPALILYIVLAAIIPAAPRGGQSYGHQNQYYGANQKKQPKQPKQAEKIDDDDWSDF